MSKENSRLGRILSFLKTGKLIEKEGFLISGGISQGLYGIPGRFRLEVAPSSEGLVYHMICRYMGFSEEEYGTFSETFQRDPNGRMKRGGASLLSLVPQLCARWENMDAALDHFKKTASEDGSDLFENHLIVSTVAMSESLTLYFGRNNQSWDPIKIVRSYEKWKTEEVFEIEAILPISKGDIRFPDITPWTEMHSTGVGVIVDLETWEGHMLLGISANGERGRFLLDTGASSSVVDTLFAERLGKEGFGAIKARGATGLKEAGFVKLESFRIPGRGTGDFISVENYMLPCLSIGGIYEQAKGRRIDGILGTDILSDYVVMLDFEKNELFLSRSLGEESKKKSNIEVKSEFRDGIAFVSAVLDNHPAGFWRLDTGSGRLDLHHSFSLEAGGFHKGDILFLSTGIDGSVARFSVREFDSFSIGKGKIFKPIVSFPIDAPKGSFADRSDQGNLGTSILKFFKITLDFTEERAFFEQNTRKVTTFPFPWTGIQIALGRGGRPKVVYVSANGPGKASGVKKGFEVLAVNNVIFNSPPDIVRMREELTKHPNVELKLRIKTSEQVEKEIIILPGD